MDAALRSVNKSFLRFAAGVCPTYLCEVGEDETRSPKQRPQRKGKRSKMAAILKRLQQTKGNRGLKGSVIMEAYSAR